MSTATAFLRHRMRRLALASVLVPLLSACASVAHVAYTPTTTRTARGAVRLGEFDYLPAAENAPSRLKMNEILLDDGVVSKFMPRMRLMLDQPVAQLVRDGIAAELVRAGVKADSKLLMTGAIDAFVPMHGALNGGLLRVHFTVVDTETGRQVYRKTQEAAGAGSYLPAGGYQGNLAPLIHQCADQLLSDPEFEQAIQRG